MKPLSEVVETFRRESVVIPLPGELGFEVAARGQGLAGFDHLDKSGQHGRTLTRCAVEPGRAYVEILCVKLSVFWQVIVFLGHEHSLTEEILVDLLAVGLGDQPGSLSVQTSSCVIYYLRTYIVASSWRSSGNRVQWRGRGCSGGLQ